ncbi:hypothetical protein [Cupriavidus basilensis]|uniref:HEAT repeat domain-containing protein n=1 Tax=Cupriavidus basilensis TaxID=68895 RepID=A0A643FJG7_9BURK|nr:hypothetical protein [Cupriavidus basilensis]QOT77332.1 hypothetical protein F7R26_004485 [Cupriavidus basilensis]
MQLRYRMLVFKLNRVTRHDRISAVEEIALAGQLAEQLEKPGMVERLVADLFDHENSHVRRIALNAVRRAHGYRQADISLALLRKLGDPEPWLRHDAAWVLHEAGLDSPHIRAALRQLAGPVMLPYDLNRAKANPTDALLHAQVRARQALDVLLARQTAGKAVAKLPYAAGTLGHSHKKRREQLKVTFEKHRERGAKLNFRRLEPGEGGESNAAKRPGSKAGPVPKP